MEVGSVSCTEPLAVPRRILIEAVVASTIGTTIEWYDFFVYGVAAALVFPALFFPQSDPFIGQILAFGTFAFGFVARPLGGVVFGAMGDRIGRKSALVTTLLLMGISTLLVGFLPVHRDIGVAASLLLVVLRFLQGLGVGGEWTPCPLDNTIVGVEGHPDHGTARPPQLRPAGRQPYRGLQVLLQLVRRGNAS
jgi:hypothetical protein